MQFTLGITGDLLTNDGKPCFGTQPLEAIYKKKQIFIEWMDPSIQVLSERETSKYDAILLEVAHDVFRKFSLNEINLLGKENYALYDVKYLFELNEVDGRL